MVAKKPRVRDVDDYLSRLPEAASAALARLRKTIKFTVPDAEEVISYQVPAFKYKGRMLIWYAGFRGHCSLFPTAAVISEHHSDLAAYRTSKGTIQFRPDKPLPVSLVKKLLRTRIKHLSRLP